MERKSRKLLSVLLCVCMLASSLFMPVGIQAADAGMNGQILTMGSNPYYSIGQDVGIEVIDPDLAGQPSITVNAASTTDTTGIAITLNPAGGTPGRFAGKIRLSADPSNGAGNPPSIQCVLGDKVDFYYEDTNNTDGISPKNTYITVAERVEAPQAILTPPATPEGLVTTDTAITLITATTDASVYYTLNGSTPVSGSAILYSEASKPVVTANTYRILKAVAVKALMANSDVITFEYNKPASFSGAVKNFADAVITGSSIAVDKKDENNQYHFVTAFPASDGSFTVDSLSPGNYRARAIGPTESEYTCSDWFEFKVTDSGAYLDSGNVPASNITMKVYSMQIRGTASSSTGGALSGNQYYLRIRPVGSKDEIGFQREEGINSFKLSKIPEGNYEIWMEPSDDLSDIAFNATSFKQTISINSSGVASPSSITLQLTAPVLTGSVARPDGSGGTVVVTSGGIDILDNMGYFLQSVKLQPDGMFKVGGMNDGNYNIRAIPPKISEFSEYQASDAISFTVSGGGTVASPSSMTLQWKKKILRVESVESLVKGDNQIKVLINNMDLIGGNPGGLTAEIGTTGITCAAMYADNRMDNSGTVHFRVPDDRKNDLQFGSYPLNVYNGTELLEGSVQNLYVVQYINPVKLVYSLEEYTTTGIAITFYDKNMDYPWSAGAGLTVKISPWGMVNEYTASANTGAEPDKRLTVNIPAQAGAFGGWRHVDVFDGTRLMAVGDFQVGTSRIDGVHTINQGDNRVSIYGNCLSSYNHSQIQAEVWKNGSLIANNNNQFYYSQDDRLEFEFPSGFDIPGDNYILKIFDNSVTGRPELTTAGGIGFKTAPLLAGSPRTISAAGEAVTIGSSTLDPFKWNKNTDNIDDFRVKIYGDGFGWDLDKNSLTSGNQRCIAFDLTGNIVVMPLGNGHTFPSNATSGRIEISRGGDKLGYAEFVIGDAIVYGSVYEPEPGTGIISAGRVFIQKQDEWDHSGRTVNIGTDGKFYMTEDDIPRWDMNNPNNINGEYTLTAIPTEGSIYAKSKPVTINITGGALSTANNIALHLENAVLAGIAKNYDGATLNEGNIEVFDNSDERKWVAGANIYSNGTFRIGGLSAGTYWIRVRPVNGNWQISSDMKQVTTGTTDITLSLKEPQIYGEVRDADGNTLNGNEYDVRTRSLDGGEGKSEWYSNDGYYVVGNLAPGRYGIRIVPKDDNSIFTQSMETELTIPEGMATASAIKADLLLTRQLFTGNVVAVTPSGDTISVTRGNVKILNQFGNYLTDTNIKSDGTFKVGGLGDGSYYVAADPDRGNPAYNNYDSSAKVPVTISGGVCTLPAGKTMTLTLRSRVARLDFVKDLFKGDGFVSARIMNSGRIDWKNVTVRAQITSGASINITNWYIDNWDDQSDSCWLNFKDFDDSALTFGKHILTIYIDPAAGDEYMLPIENSSVFNVISGAYTDPAAVDPAAYGAASTAMKLDVGGDRKEYPWQAGDSLTIRVSPEGNRSVQTTASATINGDKALSFSLPVPSKVVEGRQYVEVIRDYGTAAEQLLAACSFSVGATVIKEIKVREGFSNLLIGGKYMDKFSNSPYIEIYQDGAKIAGSSNWFNFWGNLSFNLPVGLSTGVDFTVKLYSLIGGTMQEATGLPNGGTFRVVPRLVCTDPVMTGLTTSESITINESSIAGYQWTAGQDIQAFITNPGGEYYGNATTTSGLAVGENSIQYTTTQNGFMKFPLGKGVYTVDLFTNAGAVLGYAQFIVGDAAGVLAGDVKGSNGSNTSGGAIRINKNNDDWGTEIPVGEDGKFYFPLDGFERGDGEYTLTALPSSVSADSQGTMTFRITNKEVFVNGVKTNHIVAKLTMTQIKGKVMEGTGPAKGGMVYFDQNSWAKNHFEVVVDTNGNYKLGGLAVGSYNMKASAPDGSQYLASDNQELVIGMTTEGSIALVRDLVLKKPQVTGSALDFDANPLKGYQYSVRVRNLDQFSGGNVDCEWRSMDGRYMFGGLKAGKYAVSIEPKDYYGTRSFEEVFTVNGDGTASPSAIDLKMTKAELTGTVYRSEGSTEAFTGNGYVDVFRGSWVEPEYLTTVSLGKSGDFQIGGLPDGKYWIRAALGNRWDNANSGLSISKTAGVTISTTGVPASVNLYLGDSKPRIRWVNDFNLDDSKLRVRLINVKDINSQDIDFTKLSAEVLDKNGNPLNPAVNIANAGNFWFEGDSWDDGKNEATLCINLGNTALSAGQYKLRLIYNGLAVTNETPNDISGFNGFRAYYDLNIIPFAVKPESTSNRVMELGLNLEKSKYPWISGDTTLLVRMTRPDKSQESLPYTVAWDKTLNITLPAISLAKGNYKLELIKGTDLLLAMGWLTVGYPQITEIYDIDEDCGEIPLFGSNLVTYLDKSSKLEVRDSSNNLVASSSNVSFAWDQLKYDLGGKTLKPGEYTLSLTYGTSPVVLPNSGKLNVVHVLRANPPYMITNATSGIALVLKMKEGVTAPWNAGDTLMAEVGHEGGNGSVSMAPAMVSPTAIVLTMPQIKDAGPCYANIYKIDGTGTRKFIAHSRFDVTIQTQLTGNVRNPSSQPVPYAVVSVQRKDNNEWIAGFTADENGNYAVYGIKPGNYKVFAGPPKGVALLESDSIDVNISDSSVTPSTPQAFTLKAARKISGRITLPNAETVSGSAMKMWIGAWADRGTPDNREDDLWFGRELVIPENENGVDYTILVPVDNESYRLNLWSDTEGYVNGTVYYSTSGTAIRAKDATVFQMSGGDVTGAGITLLKGKKISGTVSLPAGLKANADGVKVKIDISSDNNTKDPYDDVNCGKEVKIEQGFGGYIYDLVVPAVSDYKVKYDLETSLKLVGTGYYKNSTASAYKVQDAAIVDTTASDKADINLFLANARYITGTVTLPAGVTLPADGFGMWIGVCADQGTKNEGDDYNSGSEVKFAAGSTSGTFAIPVPDSSETYRMQLWGGTKIGCVEGVYYGESGISYNLAGAARFTVNGSDRTGMYMTLLKGKEISGTVILPAGVTAPVGGMGMSVEAIADNNTDSYLDDISAGTKVQIAQGTTSAAFRLIVPATPGFRVQYVSDPSYGFMERGYYAETGTTLEYSKAKLLDMSVLNGITGIQLNISKAKYISGTVFLPSGIAAPAGGVGLWIDVGDEKGLSDPSDDFWTGTEVYFAANTTSAAYKVAVPDNSADVAAGKSTGYVVQVLEGSKVGCVDTMYYSTSGSAFRISDAAAVDISSGNQNNINVALAKGYRITGKVSLPSGVNAPAAGMGMTVVGIVKSTGGSREDIRIYAKADIQYDAVSGKSFGDYKLSVPDLAAVKATFPDASGFKVMYVSDKPDQFESRGFYRTATETTPDYDKATAVDATATTQTGIDLNVLSVITPACTGATVVLTGTAVRLDFSKPLAKVTTAAGFRVKVGTDEYQIAGVVQSGGGTSLTLQLKDYNIYKDYTNIQVAYSDAAGVKAYDGKTLSSFTTAVTNSSTRVFSITGVVDNALTNRTVQLKVTSTDDAIAIRNADGTGLTTGSGIQSRTFDSSGMYGVKVSASGRKGEVTLNFEIDKVSPVIMIANVPDVTENNHEGVKPVVTFSGDEGMEASRAITLNGQAYDGSAAIKEAGSYVLSASAKDKAGNITTTSKAFEIVWDTGTPAISVKVGGVELLNGSILDTNPVLEIGLTGGSNAASYSYAATLKKPDGSIVSFNKDTIPSITSEGTYRLEVKAVNPSYSDITSSKVIEFTIDKNIPVAAITNVTNNQAYNTSVTPVITFSDSVASQQLLTSNAAITLTRNSSPVAFKPGDTIAIDGRYILTASTKDGKGHGSNTATVTFDIDRTKPVITLSGALDGYTYKDQDVTVTAASPDGTLAVKCNGEPLALTGGQYTFTGTPSGIMVYKLVFTSTDTAGNVTEQQLSFTIDRLPVNILVAGIAEGQTVNYSPDISYTVYEGETAVAGATATIDLSSFPGGLYSAEGRHTLVVSYKKGTNTYTKTIHFTVDKTKPVITNITAYKNGSAVSGILYVKAGDTIMVTANISDSSSIGETGFNIGSAAAKVLMKLSSGSLYEGEFKVEGGNYSDQVITVNTVDIAGNATAGNGSAVNIINTKPAVSVATTPVGPDGNNGIYRNPSMSLTLKAAASDTISYNFNGTAGTATGTKTLSAVQDATAWVQGTNTLVYFAADVAGNKSDEKVFFFEYDSIKPANVVISPALKALDNKSLIGISGTVPGEGGKAGSKVLLKKVQADETKPSEIVAQAVISASGAFLLDGIRLAEGNNKFELVARDAAGNESATAATATTKLDSTAPVIKVEKASGDDVTYLVEVLDEAVSPSAISAKFNGANIASDKISIGGAISGGRSYTIAVPGQTEGANTLNVLAVDMAGNTGAGSFTSTYIPPNEAQEKLPLNDNATMDIPSNAFTGSSSVQMLVKTVDVTGAEAYKPLGAPISFEFVQNGIAVEPSNYLVIRNFIGTGLSGVVLMHITSSGAIAADETITAAVTTSGVFSEAGMGTFETGHAYYLSDTGYLVFKTKSFSAYQVVQDNTPPVITVTTNDFDINKADAVAGKKSIAGTLDDTSAKVTGITVDGNPITLSGTTGSAFNLALPLTDGTHDVVLTAADTVGNTSSVTRTYRMDATAPVLAATAAVTQTNRNTADINVTVGESSEIMINGESKGSFNGSNVIPYTLIQGTNTITVTATDAFGNSTGAAPISIELDSVAPVITVTGVSGGDVYGGAVTIGVSATDAHLSQRTITMDGTPYTPGSYNAEGTHTLVVTATDAFGNTNSKSVTFTIDTSVPTITISGADNGGLYSSNKSLAIAASNADDLKITKSTDGQAPQNITVTGLSASVSLDADANAKHTYLVKAIATKVVSGQVRSASSTYSVTIDKKGPVVLSTTAAETEAAAINITGTVDETADLYLNGVQKYQNLPAGAFTFANTALVLGDNTFSIKAVDPVGNETTIPILVKRKSPTPVTPPSDGNTTIPSGGGAPAGVITAPAPAVATSGSAILSPLERRNNGELKPVTEPNPGTAIDSAENAAVGTTGGAVSTSGGAFGLKIPAGAVNGRNNTFRIVVFEVNPASPLAVEDQIKSGRIRMVSDVVDFGTTANELLKPVTATLRYDRQTVTNTQNLRVFYWNTRTSAWVPVAAANTRVKANEGIVEADLQHFTRYAVMEVKSTLKFTDVQKQWYATYVDRISLMGITTGVVTKNARVFMPETSISRVEFVAMLARTLKLSAPNQSLSAFKDASGIPSWAAGYVKAAYAKGIISPYKDGTFKPGQSITREEMAVMLVKAMGLKPSGDASAFKDQMSIQEAARAYVAKAAEKNILAGKGDGLFHPADSLTRAEAAKVIVEMIEVLGKL